MSINTQDQLIAAPKDFVAISKTATRTTVATGFFGLIDIAGQPGVGVLAGASTANGVVPTDATAGFPQLKTFGGGATGYLASVAYGSTAASWIFLSDCVFKAGAYGFASGTTNLTSQPSFAGRMPDGVYSETEIWIEVSTAFVTGTAWQVQVGYTNQDGVAGRSTVILPATAAGGLTLGRRYQLALQAGDSGVQQINSVTVTNGGTAMTAGAFNVLVLRPLWENRVQVNNGGGFDNLALSGMPDIFETSAVDLMVQSDGTSSGLPFVRLNVKNG